MVSKRRRERRKEREKKGEEKKRRRSRRKEKREESREEDRKERRKERTEEERKEERKEEEKNKINQLQILTSLLQTKSTKSQQREENNIKAAKKEISKDAERKEEAVKNMIGGDNTKNETVTSARNIHKMKPAKIEEEKKNVKSGEEKKTTMTEKATGEFVPAAGRVEFPWEKIGFYIDAKHPPTTHALRALAASGATSSASASAGDAVRRYISEKYYSDVYWNTALAAGTLAFAWAAGYGGGGVLALGAVLLFCWTIYRTEMRRFNTNLRDDMRRIAASESLDTRLETMDWLNSFLAKFWVIYMPALSEMVITQANNVLKDVEPPAPIRKLSLDEFTLGSKAPSVRSIRAYTKLGKDVYRMDWDFGFTPNDTDGMTREELRRKVDPKVALGISVGKGVVSASLPILVEDMSFKGRLRITLRICDAFPFIQVVSVMFLEPPDIDYALKPVGGNTFGIDVMSLVPGLSSFVKGLIDSNLRPMMYAPNHFDVDVRAAVESSVPSAVGCVGVRIRALEYARASDTTAVINPYVEYWVEGAADARHRTTDIKAATRTPVFNETGFLLAEALTQKVRMEVWTAALDGASGALKTRKLAEASFDLEALARAPRQTMRELRLEYNGHAAGRIVADWQWFAVSAAAAASSASGVLVLTVQAARGLSTERSVLGRLATYAEVRVGAHIQRSRVVKDSNVPEYRLHFEQLVRSKHDGAVCIAIKDTSSYGETTIAELRAASVAEFVKKYGSGAGAGTDAGADAHGVRFTTGAGELTLRVHFKPLQPVRMADDAVFQPPLGAYRVLVARCEQLRNLETIGTIDPYVTVRTGGREYARTRVSASTLDPQFNEVFYVPVAAKRQPLELVCMDVERMGADRAVGRFTVDVGQFFAPGYDAQAAGAAAQVVRAQLTRGGKPAGYIWYKVVYIPLLAVQSRREKLAQAQEKRREEAAAGGAGGAAGQHSLKDLEQQAAMLKDYAKHPDKYEWVDEKQPSASSSKPVKASLTLEQLASHNSGVIGINVLSGHLSQKNCYVQFLFDERTYPEFTSPRAAGTSLASCAGQAFIRDLENSIMTVRVTRSRDVESRKDVVAETSTPVHVGDALRRSYDAPIDVSLPGCSIRLMLDYIPATVDLGPSETMLDTGTLKLTFVSASGLKAADLRGKSDPFCAVDVDGRQVFRSQTVKKCLDPVFNEDCSIVVPSRTRTQLTVRVMDWNAAGDNDPLGHVALDLTRLPPGTPTALNCRLSTQGTLSLRATFRPMYVRSSGGSGGSSEGLSGVPLKLVGGALGAAGGVAGGVAEGALGVAGGVAGGALGVAGGVAGGALGVANGAATGLFKGFHRGKASKSDEKSKPKGNSELAESIHKSINPPAAPSIRRSMDTNASFASSAIPGDSIPGTATISGLSFAAPWSGSDPLCVKVSLQSPRKSKSIHRTHRAKFDNASHSFSWHESVPFKAAPGARIVFSVEVYHRLGRSTQLGSASVALADVSGISDPVPLALTVGSQEAHLTVAFNYGA